MRRRVVGGALAAVVVALAPGRVHAQAKAAPAPVATPTAKPRPAAPSVKSSAVMVADTTTGEVLFEKNAQSEQPIASITKLMTAIVVLDAKLDPNELIEIREDDKSKVKFSRSRLFIGSTATRRQLLRVALMSSDNRAAGALARTYPGGFAAAIEAMNAKARALGLVATRFDDPTGLSSGNVSTAAELLRLMEAARRYPEIREHTTATEAVIQTKRGPVQFGSTNALTRREGWDIDLQKTGFIAEAGRCLVLHARVGSRPIAMVLLDAAGRYTAIADAYRIRQWLEPGFKPPPGAVAPKK